MIHFIVIFTLLKWSGIELLYCLQEIPTYKHNIMWIHIWVFQWAFEKELFWVSADSTEFCELKVCGFEAHRGWYPVISWKSLLMEEHQGFWSGCCRALSLVLLCSKFSTVLGACKMYGQFTAKKSGKYRWCAGIETISLCWKRQAESFETWLQRQKVGALD